MMLVLGSINLWWTIKKRVPPVSWLVDAWTRGVRWKREIRTVPEMR